MSRSSAATVRSGSKSVEARRSSPDEARSWITPLKYQPPARWKTTRNSTTATRTRSGHRRRRRCASFMPYRDARSRSPSTLSRTPGLVRGRPAPWILPGLPGEVVSASECGRERVSGCESRGPWSGQPGRSASNRIRISSRVGSSAIRSPSGHHRVQERFPSARIRPRPRARGDLRRVLARPASRLARSTFDADSFIVGCPSYSTSL